MPDIKNQTQSFVPIQEVRDGIIILKDGSMRAILMTSSVNFALKSEDEQKSIIYQFQNFLNSLNFDMQIFVQSRNLDIRPYVSLLQDRLKVQTDDLMKIQIREYIQFVKSFTEQANIMTKRFFIVVPYTPLSANITKVKTGFFGSKKTNEQKNKIVSDAFAESRTQIAQRVDVVLSGVARTGVRAVQLGTEEVIEVFYQLFNPGEAEKPLVIQQ
jgi:type IV secretory pathway VirB4 component